MTDVIQSLRFAHLIYMCIVCLFVLLQSWRKMFRITSLLSGEWSFFIYIVRQICSLLGKAWGKITSLDYFVPLKTPIPHFVFFFVAALYWFCSISRRASASNCLNRPSEVVLIGCSGTGSGLWFCLIELFMVVHGCHDAWARDQNNMKYFFDQRTSSENG